MSGEDVFEAEGSSLLFLKKWMEQYPWLLAGFTTRKNGYSEVPYASNNLGLHVGDDCQHVLKNRRQLAEQLGFSLEDWVSANQTHGSALHDVRQADRGKGSCSLSTAIDECDALFTDQPGIIITSFYADCVPLFFLDPINRRIALVHAGWRGTVQQIGSKLVKKWIDMGSSIQDIRVAIGPAISGCCYEVGEEVVQQVLKQQGEERIGIRSTATGRYLLDLKQINANFLQKEGILKDHLEVSYWCTSCRTDLFFSHRREGGRTGRMASFMAIKKEGVTR